MSHGYEMYSVEKVVNNYVISFMVTYGNYIYHSNHFEMYRNIKSLCCVTGTNTEL